MAQRQAELAHYATVAHFLRENVLPNCQLCARDYKELTDAFPLLIPAISHRAIYQEWTNAGAHRILRYLRDNNKLSQHEMVDCFQEGCN